VYACIITRLSNLCQLILFAFANVFVNTIYLLNFYYSRVTDLCQLPALNFSH
jgi:hypothetical protein